MRLFAYCACAVLLVSHLAGAATRPRGDAVQQSIVDAASREGALLVYGSTNERFARYLVDKFMALYPEIVVKYVTLPVEQLDAQMRHDDVSGNGPDVVWSSAMDLQMKAALDGLAQPYRSVEAASLPSWAKWRDRLYATTYEPVVLVYNRQYVSQADVPTTHQKLRERLSIAPEKYRGKVSTYELDNGEVGALPFHLDARYDPRFWELVRAMRAEGLDEQSSSAAILDRISAGQSLIGYNIAGLEAFRRARRDPLVGVQFTMDYNLVMSRVMFIARHAPHVNAARLWVDFLLSKAGQQQMQIADLFPVRVDVANVDAGLMMLRRASKVAKPVPLDATLAALRDSGAAQAFRDRWRTARDSADDRRRLARTDVSTAGMSHISRDTRVGVVR